MNEQTQQHPYEAQDSFDGGDLDCGNGLLLLIRKHIDPLTPGQLLEILSTESSVVEDLPAWCRLTKNDLVSHIQRGKQNSFLVSKGPRQQQQKEIDQELPSSELPQLPHTTQKKRKKKIRTSRSDREQAPITQPIKEIIIPAELPSPQPAPAITPLSVMSIGWGRLMANYVEAGGSIYVCSPCFKKRGLAENNLVDGAKIVGLPR